MRNFIVLIAIIAFLAMMIFGFVCVKKAIGVGAWGPTENHEVLVNRLYVDYSGSGGEKKSHYMVGTSGGVFECDNGLLLGVWNADELYSRLQTGKWYEITTKGKKRTNWFIQEYPYITAVNEIQPKK